ncbi:MAG: hypothetical protein O8C64_16270 [Candidatus Methanoperedens sp.]|nr:hypothetical protein [Candidatus Methanoperedens sp.]MCZ7404133.1 hypothetical protein [Candidatus Methanoperedens sp.]
MEFKEINVPEGIVQQIDHEGPFAGITVDAGNGNNIHSNINLDMSYEDTLGDIEMTMGSVPVFRKSLPKKVLIHNWSSWKMVDEMNMERARYLLSTDEMLEEMLGQTRG